MLETVSRYIFIFFLYSFCGWLGESIYCSVPAKKWINRGFLVGPICPIYGTGAVLMSLTLEPIKHMGYPILVFFAGIVVCDAVEYVTSFIMEKLFHARWWDYSERFMNIKGRICLQHSIYWGIASVAYIYPIKVLFEGEILIELSSTAVYIIDAVILAIFFVDLVNAVRKALDVKKLSDKISSLTSNISESLSSLSSDITKQLDDVEKQIETFLDFDDQKNKLKNRMYKSYPFLKDSSMSQIDKVKEFLKTLINKGEML